MLIDYGILYIFSTIILLIIFFYYKIILNKNLKLIFIIFYIYITIIIGITIFPIPINIPQFYNNNEAINLVPIKSIFEIFFSSSISFYTKTRQLVGNIIIFLPFGFLIPFLIRNFTIKKIIFILILSSILIEFLQLNIGLFIVGYNYRSFDIDDIILNSIGGILGYFIYAILKQNKSSI